MGKLFTNLSREASVMDIETIAIFAAIAGSMVTIGIVIYALNRRSSEDESLDALQTLLGGEKSYGSITTTLSDATLEYGMFAKGSGNNKSYFFMYRIPLERAFHFTVTEESGFDTFAKNSGLAVEVQTGDKIFDDRFYISAPDSNVLRTFVESSERRERIAKFFDAGFHSLGFSSDKLFLEARSDFLNGKSPEEAKQLAESFIELSKDVAALGSDVSSLETSHMDSKSQGWLVGALLAVVFTGIGVLIAGLAFYNPLDPWSMFVHSLMYSIPLCVFVTFQLISMVRGRSDGHKILATVLAFTIPSLLCVGQGLTAGYNGYFDKSEAVTHTQRIERVTYSKSDDSTSYYAIIQSWRKGEDTEKIQIGRREYKDLKKRLRSMEIVTRTGALGFEWLISYEIVD